MQAAQARPTRPPIPLIGLPLGVLAGVVGLAISIALLFGGAASCGSAAAGSVRGVPANLAPIYEQAAARYGLGAKGPAVLAAINHVETDFGRNMSTSGAGALGWMQFLPSTWAIYGVDANGDGRRDPSDPWDAIFAAASYLRASGAPADWHAAILAYNHAEWYVADVLAGARRFAGTGSLEVAGFGGCAVAASGPAVQRMVAEAARIDALRLPYVWGGSHGQSPTPPNGPFDCSSAVSHLLQVAGFGNPTMDTAGLAGWGESGPGRLVTIHVKPHGADAHTFVEFRPGVASPTQRYWGTSNTNPNGGPGWIPQHAFSPSYLAGFELRHPAGL